MMQKEIVWVECSFEINVNGWLKMISNEPEFLKYVF